jgi:hypothetical protein
VFAVHTELPFRLLLSKEKRSPATEVQFFVKHEADHLSQMYKGTRRLLHQSKFLESWRRKCSASNSNNV